MGIINSGFLTVSTFLQQHIYHIPEYQRGYSWTEDQIEDLWIDLMQLDDADNLFSHFLGQIVVHNDKDDKKMYIIDGQQRTSTIIILLDTFRQLLDKIDDEYSYEDAKIDADDITTKYIGRVTAKREDQRLYLGDSDQKFFKEVIQVRGNDKAANIKKKKSKSEKLIQEASKFYLEKLTELMDSNNIKTAEQKYHMLSQYLDVFLNSFKLMYVETDDINEAFIIFETLNARGKDLETSDLLKNHVYRSADNKVEIVKQYWNQMIDNLGSIDPTKFIRHYWNSKYKFVREKDLYKNIRKIIDTPKKVEDLLEELVELSELYTSLNNPDYTYFQYNNLNERNKEIKNLGASSYYPIILALENEKFNEQEIDKILEGIECLIVRNFVVAGKTANKFEVEFAKIAYQISQHQLNHPNEIIKAIKNLTINDEEFIDDFKIFTTKKANVIRYILRKIHNHSNSEMRIIDDNNSIHIEHIMPKKPKKYWDVSKEVHQEYLSRLGNLTLLGQEYNRSATNKDFKSKKKIYQESDIPMTKDLISFKEWTWKDIEKRQESFVNAALEIWKK